MEIENIISGITLVTTLLTLVGVGIIIGTCRNKISNNTKASKENKKSIADINNKHHIFVEKAYDKFEKVYDKLDAIKISKANLLQTTSPTTLSKKGKKYQKNLMLFLL